MFDKLNLDGVSFGPSQVWKNVRLVPLIREKCTSDLRLTKIDYDQEYSQVYLNDQTSYESYIPFGLIASWGTENEVRFNQQALVNSKKKKSAFDHHFRLVGKVDKNKVRILPFHMAMEAFLSTAFKRPEVRKKEFTNEFNRFGLQYRSEFGWKSEWLEYVNASLGVFEILENQCGMMIFISDSLASCFLLPNHSDYRYLHYTLLMDCYSELMWHYSCADYDVQKLSFSMDEDRVRDVKTLRKEFDLAMSELESLDKKLASGLLDRDLFIQKIYKLGKNELSRFRTDFFEGRDEDHIGEIISDSSGVVQYLKTYRLGIDQLKRGKFLQRLEEKDWDISSAARADGLQRGQWLRAFVKAGLGDILNANTLSELRD